jgi:hypothetical protein
MTWQQAAHEAQLSVDITFQISTYAKALPESHNASGSGSNGLWSFISRAVPACGSRKAGPAITKGRKLAAWLAKKRGTVRSLHIMEFCGRTPSAQQQAWQQDMDSIIAALTHQQWVPCFWAPWQQVQPLLPHLVKLDLPILGIPRTREYLGVLAGCPCLQHLALRDYGSLWGDCDLDPQLLGDALAPLTQLRTFHLGRSASLQGQGGNTEEALHRMVTEPSRAPDMRNASLAGLLRQLPSSLETLSMQQGDCTCGDVPLSCITHFTNLKQWEYPPVRMVVDDGGSGITALTALTRLCISERLFSDDVRLQLPNLCSIQLYFS